MLVGLIPPRGLENFALGSNFHLALALPDLMARKTYGHMYARAARLGDFVVLDNGAAEHALVDDADLMQAATIIGAAEVVAPDVIRDGKATIKRTKVFITKYRPQVPLMAVPQGINLGELQSCVHNFAAVAEITTLGIPRHLIKTLNVKSARIDLANWIQEKYPDRFHLHMLGMEPTWLQEVRAAHKYAPHIRSIDSSLPFNYAMAELFIGATSQAIARPNGYLSRDWNGRVKPKLVRQNIEQLIDWAGAPAYRSVIA